MGCSGLDERACAVATALVISGAQGQGDGEALWSGRSRQACRAASTLGGCGHLLAARGPVVVTGGLWDRSPPCRAVAQQGWAASSARAGRPHRSRIDRGWRKQAPAAPGGHRWGIARGVCRVAAGAGLPRARGTQDARKPLVGAEVGAPRPGDATCDGHDTPLAVGSPGLEPRFRGGLLRAVHTPVAIVAHEADGQGAGLQVDTTVNGVWLGGDAAESR
jgi:hypothetical protein